ncbi:MAG TPA: hypothetical protein VL899_11385 [Alphaproteobacteria bacterium]|nr:hypothetical protein [Alphaproteobacteria bacterium]
MSYLPASLISPGPTRAYCKVVGVSVFLGVALGTAITLINRDHVNDLRHHLTIWLLLAIVAGINVAAFLLFTVGYAVYRWIRRDLNPERDDF